MSEPSISVVIPCYNKSAFISDCIQSVAGQSRQPLEIIVVDDGSTDASAGIVRSLANTTVKLLEKTNGGVSDARNFGITHASGNVIVALDADDEMKPGYIQKVASVFATTRANLVSCSVEMIGSEVSEWVPDPYDPYVERYHNVIPTLVAFKKEIWEAVGGYRRAFVFNEDWDFFIRAEQYPLLIGQIPEKLLRYRVDPAGLSSVYIKDTWEHSVSLVMSANDSKYPVDKLYKAHTTLGAMPERWSERFERQYEMFPDEWLLALWLGLSDRSRGRVDRARERLRRAVELSDGKNWQPFFALWIMARAEADQRTSAECLHWIRLLRPDTEPAIAPFINSARPSST